MKKTVEKLQTFCFILTCLSCLYNCIYDHITSFIVASNLWEKASDVIAVIGFVAGVIVFVISMTKWLVNKIQSSCKEKGDLL